jgi:hypothetical protein
MNAIQLFKRSASAALAVVCLTFWLLAGAIGSAWAQPLLGSSTKQPSEAVEQSLGYLMSMIRDKRVAFEPEKIQALLEFVSFQAEPGAEYELKRRDGLNGASLTLDLRTSLDRVLRYVYNPAIPTYIMYPTVVRRSAWLPGSDLLNSNLKLWRLADNLTAPVVLHGQEFEEITPDASSGGYYSYDLDRILILTPFQGRPTFISVSKQKGPSSVGKKGASIDGGKDWTFVYTKEEGLTTGGLSWMDTFMYDQFSVTVYAQLSASRPMTRYGVFSWLRAGWASINVIKPSHIYDGCLRAGNELKLLLESDSLPPPDELAEKVQKIKAMSDSEMLQRLTPLSKALAQMGAEHPVLRKSDFAEVVSKGRYAENLSRDERTSLLIKEYLKKMMGRPSYLDGEIQ